MDPEARAVLILCGIGEAFLVLLVWCCLRIGAKADLSREGTDRGKTGKGQTGVRDWDTRNDRR
jgi:hypothetical protein